MPDQQSPSTEAKSYSPEWFKQRAKYIPLRLSAKERKVLRLIEAALEGENTKLRLGRSV
jgi:hypothetical protein